MILPAGWIVYLMFSLLLCARAEGQTTERASISSRGVVGNNWSQPGSVSADGRYVAFYSYSSNLVIGDTNGYADVFLRDRLDGVTSRISVSSGGAEGNGASIGGWMSLDARYVSFSSQASNLVPGDTNGKEDAFVRDRISGTTELISKNTAGIIGDGSSWAGPITPDGRFVTFLSDSSNMVTGAAGGHYQVFVRDRTNGTTEIASVSTGGIAGNGYCSDVGISADGQLIVFLSTSDNLVVGDTNFSQDAFIHDRRRRITERVSVGAGGAEADGDTRAVALSGNGRFVAFACDGTNLVANAPPGRVNLYVRDLQLGLTELESIATDGSPGNGDCESPCVSDDGRYVEYSSDATNLVPNDSNGFIDVFVRDRQRHATIRDSVNSQGIESDGDSVSAVISINGLYVCFESEATNLILNSGGGGGNYPEVFLRERFGVPNAIDLCNPGAGGVRPCPCANPAGAGGRGCDNSEGAGGSALLASGGSFLSSDSLEFHVSGAPSDTLCVLLQGTQIFSSGVVFGQGVRCAGGAIKRLFARRALGDSVVVPDFERGDSQVSSRSAVLGDVVHAGESRYYFIAYRDRVVLGGCPATTRFNCTQTIQIAWSP
jgi:Tol biopolymer transport system component